MRLIPSLAGFAFLALGTGGGPDRRRARRVAAMGLAFLAIRIGGSTLSLDRQDVANEADLAAIDRISPYSRVAVFVGHPCHSGWSPNRFDHLAAMATVRKSALTTDQWDVPGAQIVRPIYPGGPDAATWRDPHQIVTARPCGAIWSLDQALTAIPAGVFDYLWLINPPAFDPGRLRDADEIWRNGSSALFRLPAGRPTGAAAAPGPEGGENAGRHPD